MSIKHKIEWPEWATHARQTIDGIASVVKKSNADILIPEKGTLIFGRYEQFTFKPEGETYDKPFLVLGPEDKPKKKAKGKKKAAQASQEAAQSAFFNEEGLPTVGGIVVRWEGRRAVIVRRIFEGQLKAKEIAEEISESFGIEYRKAHAHVKATVAHLRQQLGIVASYRKVNGDWTPPTLVGGEE